MGEQAGDVPEGPGRDLPEPYGSFEDLSIEFDEEFVRAATIHEPSARARMLASQWDSEPPESTVWREMSVVTPGSSGPRARAVGLPPRRHRFRVSRLLRWWAQRHPVLSRLTVVLVTGAVTVGALALTR